MLLSTEARQVFINRRTLEPEFSEKFALMINPDQIAFIRYHDDYGMYLCSIGGNIFYLDVDFVENEIPRNN